MPRLCQENFGPMLGNIQQETLGNHNHRPGSHRARSGTFHRRPALTRWRGPPRGRHEPCRRHRTSRPCGAGYAGLTAAGRPHAAHRLPPDGLPAAPSGVPPAATAAAPGGAAARLAPQRWQPPGARRLRWPAEAGARPLTVPRDVARLCRPRVVIALMPGEATETLTWNGRAQARVDVLGP
jgi:hypothetical protein